jgi:hypothetical protein
MNNFNFFYSAKVKRRVNLKRTVCEDLRCKTGLLRARIYRREYSVHGLPRSDTLAKQIRLCLYETSTCVRIRLDCGCQRSEVFYAVPAICKMQEELYSYWDVLYLCFLCYEDKFYPPKTTTISN